jgi:DNA-binding response OmpR family regulator
LRVLLVEDNPADLELELLTLRKDGFEVAGDVAQTAEEFAERILTTHYDLILADYDLPQWRGTEALHILRRENLDVPLIVVTGYLGEEKAVDYIKQGAH